MDIPFEEMMQDLRDTQREIADFRDENEILMRNRERNRVSIYLNEGRISQREDFVEKLTELIKITYPEQYKKEDLP
jgi:hypothetical protein